MIRVALILATQLLLWLLLGALNHNLAGWQVQVFAAGLFITYPAMRMDFREGLPCVLLAGFLHDASAPVPFGQSALLFGLAFLLMLQLRPRLAHEEPLVQAVIAAVAGIVLYLLRLALMAHLMPSVSGIWGRYFWELALSTVLVGLAGPWFFALQERCLQLSRLRLLRRHADDDEP